MELILIPAGEFSHGLRKRKHVMRGRYGKYRFQNPFYLGKYPVTQEQWETVMENNPATLKATGSEPVEHGLLAYDAGFFDES